MKKLPFAFKFSVLLYILVIIALAAFAQQPVIASHPRIFLDATTKAALLAKKNSNSADWQAVLTQANKYTQGTVIPWNVTSASDAQYYGTNNIFYSYCGSSWEEAAMTLGMAHQLTKGNNTGAYPTAYSNKMMEFADVITQAYQTYPPNESGGPNIFQFNTSYATRHVGKTIAVIYDYCYDELSPARKAALLHVMKDWFTYMSGAPYRVFQLQDGPTGNYFFGQVICAGYMGLAIAGDDPLSQKMLDFARQRITGDPGSLNPDTRNSGETANNYFTQSIKGGLPTAAAQEYLGPTQYLGAPQKDGMQNQGWSYGGETDCYLVDYLTALKSATGEDMLQTDASVKTFFTKTSVSIVHAFTPNRFQIDNGNDNGGFIGNVANYGLTLRLSAILDGTPEGANFEYFRTNLLQPVNLLTGNTGTVILPWEKLLYNKTRTATAFTYKPYYPVPAVNTYNAPAINTGMHRYIMRKDWSATSTWAAVNMNIGVFDAHKHNKAGHFQIVRGDSHDGDDELLIGANEVSKAGGNGIDGPTNYSFTNSFDNTLFFNDFNDYDIPYQDYPNLVGGQTNNGYDEPTHEEQNDNFTYLRSDLTSAYFMSYAAPDTSQRTLKYYYRSFLYLRNSDMFVVYDKLLAKNSTNASGQYQKHLRWHFLTAPTVSGNNITEVMDNSKLFIHTVIPATTNVAVVNENTNPDNTFGSGYDYAFNTNTWRAEVSVTGNPLKQDIVTVLQPGSKTSLTEMVTTAIQTNQNNMEGSMIVAGGNTDVVLFNKTVAKYPAPITLTSYAFTGPATANHTLCGMDPNKNYHIDYSASVVTVTESVSGTVTASPSGVLTFKLQSAGLSNNAALAALTTSSGTLTPAFATATTSYTASVSNATASITLTPVTSDANASVKVNGVTVASGSASGAIALSVGNNTINTVVTAQDGSTTKTYTVVVTRVSNNAYLANLTLSSGTLSPAFAVSTASYTASVSSATTSITVTPTVNNPGATVKVNGTTVVSGTASTAIPLSEGANIITAVVTAQDGVTHKTYTITVSRPSADASLSNLTISSGTLSPAFATATGSYTASVSNATTSVTITPTLNNANASLTVNGVAVVSGTASGAISLNVGNNTISTVVTAQDGTTHKTYTITITRVSNNAYLTNLTLSSGTLSPAFAMATGSYTASVSNAVTSVTVTPTLNNPYGTIKVNGNAVTSGTASSAISLNVGANTITTLVTAQDGVTHKTYTITVTRATSGFNSFYLPGSGGQNPLVSSLDEKVEANNILSPNGDGINDIWVVKNIAFYPNNIVTVFNSDGQVVFTKKGYTNDWDGSARGSKLNEGTYYYKIDLGNGKVVRGFISVVSH